jgi:hypothetical protein
MLQRVLAMREAKEASDYIQANRFIHRASLVFLPSSVLSFLRLLLQVSLWQHSYIRWTEPLFWMSLRLKLVE